MDYHYSKACFHSLNTASGIFRWEPENFKYDLIFISKLIVSNMNYHYSKAGFNSLNVNYHYNKARFNNLNRASGIFRWESGDLKYDSQHVIFISKLIVFPPSDRKLTSSELACS